MKLNTLIDFLTPSFILKKRRINEYFDSLGKKDLLADIDKMTLYRISSSVLKRIIIYAYNIGIADQDLLSILQDTFSISSGRTAAFESLSYRKMQSFITGTKFIH